MDKDLFISQKNSKTTKEFLEETFAKMAAIRHVEELIKAEHEIGAIKVPIYLGRGQESIAASLATLFGKSIAVFPQHRGHSYFLAFGGSADVLLSALRGDGRYTEAQSWGSASIALPKRKLFGHSGLMGDQVPMAVGYCLAMQELTLTVVGDASAEEDYVLSAIGFASHRRLPLVLVCEDNDFSILTPKSDRRSWSLVEVSQAFGCEAKEVSDDPELIREAINSWTADSPLVLNVLTNRHLWHAGSGQDAEPEDDRYLEVRQRVAALSGSDVVAAIEKRALRSAQV